MLNRFPFTCRYTQVHRSSQLLKDRGTFRRWPSRITTLIRPRRACPGIIDFYLKFQTEV
jgi:hypothetical protein